MQRIESTVSHPFVLFAVSSILSIKTEKNITFLLPAQNLTIPPVANQCWGFINGTIAALVVIRFRRRRIFLLSTISMCLRFIGWTIAQVLATSAIKKKNNHAAIAVLFFIFAYSPCYNIGNNASHTVRFSSRSQILYWNVYLAYLVELFLFVERSRGIAVEQFFERGARFFSTYVNPIALKAITWKYLTVYRGWIFIEICFVFLFYPETYGQTLEELAFCEFSCFIAPTPHSSQQVERVADNVNSVRR
jgi:hypothetical protein